MTKCAVIARFTNSKRVFVCHYQQSTKTLYNHHCGQKRVLQKPCVAILKNAEFSKSYFKAFVVKFANFFTIFSHIFHKFFKFFVKVWENSA